MSLAFLNQSLGCIRAGRYLWSSTTLKSIWLSNDYQILIKLYLFLYSVYFQADPGWVDEYLTKTGLQTNTTKIKMFAGSNAYANRALQPNLQKIAVVSDFIYFSSTILPDEQAADDITRRTHASQTSQHYMKTDLEQSQSHTAGF